MNDILILEELRNEVEEVLEKHSELLRRTGGPETRADSYSLLTAEELKLYHAYAMKIYLVTLDVLDSIIYRKRGK